MKFAIGFLLLFSVTSTRSQSIFTSEETNVTFFSSALIEDITAKNNTSTSLIKVASGEVVFRVPIKGFTFEKSMMQEHFNEKKYMWSDKYPYATYEGKINGDYSLTENGTYKVTTTGTLTIRGVAKERTIEGTITVEDGKVKIHTEFYVLLADHKIERPTLVLEHIADKILVTLDATYIPYVPKK